MPVAKSDVSDLYGKSATGLGNRWVHVVAVFRNGSVTGSKLYIDGVLQTLTQLSGTPVASPTATSAASISGTDAGVFHINGGMDELAIYSSALSATRVSAHYASSQNYTATYTYDGDGLRASAGEQPVRSDRSCQTSATGGWSNPKAGVGFLNYAGSILWI